MTRPYSEDLRERAVARFEAGETTRSIAAALRISPSCVSKWLKLKRETGSLAPGQVGGHKKRDAVRRAGGVAARALPVGAVHDARPDGGTGSRAASRPTGAPCGCSCTPKG